MTDFSERYKSYSVFQLVEILENRKKYQPAAITSARAELESRNIGPSEIQAIKNDLAARDRQAKEQDQARRDKIQQISSKGLSVVSNFASPVTSSASPHDKVIKAICVVFFIQFLWLLPEQFDMGNYLLHDVAAKWGPLLPFYFLPSILLPPAIVLFWLKKKTGWVLLAIHLFYSVFNPVFIIIAGYLQFDRLIVPLQALAIALLFFGATLYYILTEPMRTIYLVDRNHIGASSIIAIVLSIISSWAMLQ